MSGASRASTSVLRRDARGLGVRAPLLQQRRQDAEAAQEDGNGEVVERDRHGLVFLCCCCRNRAPSRHRNEQRQMERIRRPAIPPAATAIVTDESRLMVARPDAIYAPAWSTARHSELPSRRSERVQGRRVPRADSPSLPGCPDDRFDDRDARLQGHAVPPEDRLPDARRPAPARARLAGALGAARRLRPPARDAHGRAALRAARRPALRQRRHPHRPRAEQDPEGLRRPLASR